MERMFRTGLAIGVALLECVRAQKAGGALNLDRVRTMPAVSGHEQALSREILEELKALSPKTDTLGNVYVTVGSGAPQRLIVTSMDEPGYVVSEITAEGYLRVQRLPQAAPNPVFDALHFAEPVWVVTRSGKMVNGVFAGLSVHLSPGRLNPPKMNHIEEMYVDIGAKNAEEVRGAGVDLLDPVSLQRNSFSVGKAGSSGPATGDRLNCEILLQLAARLKESTAQGTTTIAFVTQQWLGGRGLNRLLTELHPDEMIFVGRVTPVPPAEKDAKIEEHKPGSGVLLGVAGEANRGRESLASRVKALAEKEQIALQTVNAAPPRIAAYTKGASLPEQFVTLGVPLLFPATPAETALREDTDKLQRMLESYLGVGQSAMDQKEMEVKATKEGSMIQALTEVYGASGHEAAVREEVKRQLPKWAQEKATTDAAGNLVLHVGEGVAGKKTQRIAFVAHMDEIGYEVKKIEDDGRFDVDVLGGGYMQYFLGHVALVHTKNGAVGAVLELPSGWEKAGYEWPTGSRMMDEPARVYVGTHTKDETEKLGIAVGDYITIPKQYRALAGTRANARSFDDRVGCAALIAAVNAIGPNLRARDVTFVWSTEEEVGLKGAATFAEQAAKEGREPDFVFAVDTFVSADSPLESKRFGDAEIGKGFVVRAVDNSNVVATAYVDRLVALARENHIAAQYGVTGGGNDGSVFLRYGAVDVALGWPLRYSHSPGEVIDTKDLDALAKIVEVLARKW
jgi:putative aminopeptidase